MLYKIVQYGAPWCTPCKMLKPLVEDACTKYNLSFEYIDIDTPEGMEKALQEGVRNVPKLFVVNQQTGERQATDARTASQLDDLMNALNWYPILEE